MAAYDTGLRHWVYLKGPNGITCFCFFLSDSKDCWFKFMKWPCFIYCHKNRIAAESWEKRDLRHGSGYNHCWYVQLKMSIDNRILRKLEKYIPGKLLQKHNKMITDLYFQPGCYKDAPHFQEKGKHCMESYFQ